MITIIFGTDHDQCRLQSKKLLDTSVKNGFSITRLSLADFSETQIIEELRGEDLFASQKVFVLSNLLDKKEIRQLIATWESSHNPHKQIICIEETLLAAQKKELAKNKDITFHEYKKVAVKDNRIFGLADSMGARNVKKMWMTFQDLIAEGTTPHQMIGILWWQMKNMLLVARSQGNPGLAPFVFNKTKTATQNFSKRELFEKADDLLVVYHRGHNGDDIGVLIEQFILGLGK